MGVRAVSLGSVLVVALLGWYLRPQDGTLLRIAARLEALEGSGEVARPRVAVGYGACYDIFADVAPLLNQHTLDGEPEHFDTIASLSELLRSFAYYFQHGAAAERFMSNSSLFDELVALAEKHPSARWAVGGNAPVMASRFLTEGCEVLLASKMTTRLKNSLPERMKSVGGDLIEKDDVHLILEYKADTVWGPYKAPRANRYILHNDENNPMVSSLEPFGEKLPDFNANLLVVSGLQMMDSYPFPKGVREDRLSKIKNQMIAQMPSTLIHFEMASYVEAKLVVDLTDLIIPYSDSLGMNEQELANLYQTLEYGNISIVADSNPRVATALDQMRQIFKIIRRQNANVPDSRTLSRIHVHTLAYQAILTLKGSAWKHTKAAVAKASLTAHRHVCGTDSVSPTEVKLVMDDSFSTSAHKINAERINFDPEHPVSCWDEHLNINSKNTDIQICVAPVLVCTNARQTAGAGDNISAAGLVLQI